MMATPALDKIPPDLSLVLDSLPQAVVITDDDLGIYYVNATTESLFQASSPYLQKKKLENFLPFGSSVISLVRQAKLKKGPVNDYQIDISTPRTNGNVIVDCHACPIPEWPEKILLVMRERSLADRIDRQLSHRGAAKSVTGLSAMLAHEIKNPLSGIRGAAQLLGSTASSKDMELLQLITQETDRIVKLLDRMEVFSDDTPIDSEAVNMHSVLGRVRQSAESGFGKNIHFEERYDPSLPRVSGSKDQLIQVFINLVKNSAEALEGRKNSKIKLSSAYRPGIHLSSPGSKERAALPLEFSVSDNGPGIPTELRAHIFEPFVTSRLNGSGLGLALVAKIIGQHGGVIECDSSPAGTTFKILLPAWLEDDQAKVEQP